MKNQHCAFNTLADTIEQVPFHVQFCRALEQLGNCCWPYYWSQHHTDYIAAIQGVFMALNLSLLTVLDSLV